MKKFNLISLFLLYSLLLLTRSLNGIISFTSFQKGDKKVLLLGDYHRAGLNVVNGKHSEAILGAIKNKSTECKITVLLELEPEHIKKCHQLTHLIPLPATFNIFSPYLNSTKIIPGIEFIASDLRHHTSGNINGIFSVIEEYIFKLHDSNGLFNTLREIGEKLETLTWKDYFEGLQEQEDCIATWRDTFDDQTPEFGLLNNKYKQFKLAHYELLEKSKSIEPTINLTIAVAKLLEEGCNEKSLDQAHLEFSALMLQQLDFLVQDVAFLQSILQNKMVILIAGDAHCTKIADDLKQLNYTLVAAEQMKRIVIDPRTNVIAVQPTKQFEDAIVKAVEWICGRTPVCKWCGKTTQNLGKTLVRCGRCKQIRYCGKECQAKHWPQHKPVCTAKK